MIKLVTLEPRHAKALEALQKTCFPTLAPHELMREEHFLSHHRVFPEGDFVALDVTEGERVVGLGSGFLTDFDFDHPNHTFKESSRAVSTRTTTPTEAGTTAATSAFTPDYRGRGIGKLLYEARKKLVVERGLKGIVAGGVLPGYTLHKGKLSVPEYVEQVVAGKLTDPTLSFQLKNGFEVRGLLENYLEDDASDDWATLIVWENYHD